MKKGYPMPPNKDFKKKELLKQMQTAEFIYQLGESPILRQASKKVGIKQIGTQEFQDKLNYLKNCLETYRGITGMGRGIAAVQVGIHEAFAVVYTKSKLIAIINPVITKKAKKLLKYPEICMSSAPVIAPVIRPAWIEFAYRDEKGVKHFWKVKNKTFTGKMLNRVFQHEIDHINGIVNIDRVRSSKELVLNSDPEFYKTAGFETLK